MFPQIDETFEFIRFNHQPDRAYQRNRDVELVMVPDHRNHPFPPVLRVPPIAPGVRFAGQSGFLAEGYAACFVLPRPSTLGAPSARKNCPGRTWWHGNRDRTRADNTIRSLPALVGIGLQQPSPSPIRSARRVRSGQVRSTEATTRLGPLSRTSFHQLCGADVSRRLRMISSRSDCAFKQNTRSWTLMS